MRGSAVVVLAALAAEVVLFATPASAAALRSGSKASREWSTPELRAELQQNGQSLIRAAGSALPKFDPYAIRPLEPIRKETDKFAKDFNESGSQLPGKLEAEYDGLMATFLPGFVFSWLIFCKAAITVVFAMIWFFVYLSWIYKDDRKEGTDHWKELLEKVDTADNNMDEIHPDLIIVFHHPAHDYADSASKVKTKSITRIMVPGSEEKLPFLAKAKELAMSGDGKLMKMAADAAEDLKSGTMDVGEMTETLGDFRPKIPFSQKKDELDELAIKNVRKSMLKDIYKQVPEWGFDIASFSSIDGDELFVAITVSSREAIEYYLDREDIALPLRMDIAERLGIGQDPSDPASHPPDMPRNQGIVNALHREGVIETADMDSLYKPHAAGVKKSNHVSSRECIRIIYRELASIIDLGAAKEEGFIVGWYPVHNPKRVQGFLVTWANWWNISHWSFVQPIPEIRDYFGAKVAFQFAWNGVYLKGLLMLLLVAGIQVTTIFVLQNVFGIYALRSKQVIGFCTTVALWSRIVCNMYGREEKFFCALWHLGENASDLIQRPQFVGIEQPSLVDTNLTDQVFARSSRNLRLTVSSLVTLFMCAAVAACIFLWMVTFEGRMGTVASILLAIQIKIFGAIFHWIAVKITDYENHKFGDDYYNSFLAKLFLFEFVNNYSAFFFMTLWGQWRGRDDASCPGGDCLSGLRSQLATTLFVICIFSIIGSVLAKVMVMFGLWWEVRQFRQKFDKDPPPLLKTEEQAKYTAIGAKEEVMTTMPLMIVLGYVLLFGGVSAAIIPLAFGAFAVHMRSSAILYTSYAQRTFPQKPPGIGSWSLVVQFLMCAGVCYSGFLFAAFGAVFEGSPLVAKMTGFLLFCFFIFIAWGFIDIVFPACDGTDKLLEKRRSHVLRKLTLRAAACEDSELSKEGLEAKAHACTRQADAVENDDWDSIGPLCDLHATQRATDAN